MTTCAVRDCQNNSSDDVKFYKFPAYEYWQNKWLEAIDRKNTEINVRTACICADHFKDGSYKNVIVRSSATVKKTKTIVKQYRILKTNAIPQLNLSVSEEMKVLRIKVHDNNLVVLKRSMEQLDRLLSNLESQKHEICDLLVKIKNSIEKMRF